MAHLPPLVGRHQEFEVLGDCLRRVASGPAGAVFVRGEAGIGKTRLVQEVLRLARALGFTCLVAAAEELERSRPFGAVTQALAVDRSSPDPQRRRLAELVLGAPGTRPAGKLVGGGPAAGYLITEGVVQLVETLATAGPVILVLEDLQWADQSSLLALHAVGRRLGHLPVALVGTLRPSPRSTELEGVMESLRHRGARVVDLAPLEEAPVHALVRHLAGAPPGPRFCGVLAGARGNPLLVVELVRALKLEGALTLAAQTIEVTRCSFSGDLRAALLRGLRCLPSETQDALRVASVLGGAFRPTELALVTNRSAVELLPALEEALRAGILEEAQHELAFRHDLIREAIYEDIPRPLRASVHRETARVLAEACAPASRVAEHFSLGAAPGDMTAVRWLREAARAAYDKTPSVAASLLERALELAGGNAPEHDHLVSELVASRLWSGRVRDAEALAREALGQPHDPEVGGALRIALVLCLLVAGRTSEVCRESERAVRDPELPGWAKGQLRAHEAFGRLYTGELPAAVSAAEAARSLALAAGDDFGLCMAVAARSQAELYEGRPHEALTLLEGMMERAEAPRNIEAQRFHFQVFYGFALLDLDRFADAERAFARGRAVSERLGLAWNLPLYQWMFFLLRFHAGDWDDAVAEAAAGFALADEVGTRIGSVCVASALAAIELHRGELRHAREHLARAETELSASGSQPFDHWLLWVSALLAETRGDQPRVLTTLEEAWERANAFRQVSDRLVLGPDLVRQLVAVGAQDRARAVADGVEEVAARTATPTAAAVALSCRGLAEADATILAEAAAAAGRSPRPLVRATVTEDAGMALARAGREAEGARLLEMSAAEYERLRAARDVARVDAALRSLGVHRTRPTRRRRPTTGWPSLTRTERDVVRLVLEGLTNRQVAERLFISRRTVDAHVSHVFAKLGCSSRMELARMAAEAGAGGASRPTIPGELP